MSTTLSARPARLLLGPALFGASVALRVAA